jgi:hypothetical protein
MPMHSSSAIEEKNSGKSTNIQNDLQNDLQKGDEYFHHLNRIIEDLMRLYNDNLRKNVEI